MSDSDEQQPQHLGRTKGPIHWDWSGENPVEILLVVFVLVLFFMLPRSGCVIEKTAGSMPDAPSLNQPRNSGR